MNECCCLYYQISTIWKKIADVKRKIELSLIKQAMITHYTPLGGFANISEVYYLKKFNTTKKDDWILQN
jgi:hypothetical protein